MPIEFGPTGPAEQVEVARFLADVFQMPDAPFLDPALMRWKYFDPRADFEGSRSFAMRNNGAIAAHGVAFPLTFRSGSRDIKGMIIGDWAGSASVPGAGGLLYRKMLGLVDFLIGVGGSDDARRVLPRMGFRVDSEEAMYARPVRPLRLAARKPGGLHWKTAAKFGRNLAWSFGSLAPADGWSAEPVSEFDAGMDSLIAGCAAANLRSLRTAGRLNYALRCPGAKMRGYLLKQDGKARGYCLTSEVLGQTRIADLGVDNADSYAPAYGAVVRAAAGDPETLEILAGTNDAAMAAALESNSFRVSGRTPVFVLDPKKTLEGLPKIDIQMIEGDEFFLKSPGYPFQTA